MITIQSTDDILNLVISSAIILVSFTFTWFIYYLAMMMRQMFLIVKEMRARTQKLDVLIEELRAKFSGGLSGALYMVDGVKTIMKAINDRKEKSTAKSSSMRKKKKE